MNETKNDGGPAFPQHTIARECSDKKPIASRELGFGDMTARDWFAANASEEDIQEFIPGTSGGVGAFFKANGFYPTRQWARYQHADHMLKAREQ